MERLLSLVKSGRLDADKLITYTFRGLETIESAFDLIAAKPVDLIKPIVYL